MKPVRALLVTLAALAVAFGCERSPTGPPPAAVPNSAPTGLVSCSELPYESVTQMIGPEGGTVSIGPHTLLIPAGALAKRVSITAVIETGLGGKTRLVEPPKGSNPKRDFVGVNAVRFRPHLKFQTPAYLTMSYANCDLGDPGSLVPRIVYTNPVLNVILENEPSDHPSSTTVAAWIEHFSTYAVAW